MACKKLKFTGKDVIVRYHINCGDAIPLETEWKRMMALRSRGLEITWDAADSTDGDSIGALREQIATFQSMSITGDGTVKVSGAGADNHREFTKHVVKPDATDGQPVMWLQFIYPDLTFTAFCMVSTLSRTGAYDDVVTYSFEAGATASDFGLIVEDTPDADAADPTGVQVIPAALPLKINQTYDLQAVTLPAGAAQNVTWSSATPAVATVDAYGVVSALTAGSSVITATSKADVTKKASSTVTVTAA